MKKNALCFIMALLLSCSLLMAQAKKEEPEKPHQDIVETVTVENIVVPVRVFDQKKMVGGLTKEDFQLFINGQSHPINGFYQQRKKLTDTPATAGEENSPQNSRLFVLIFNLCDDHQNWKGILDVFFAEIIRPGDYLIVISNNFFFPEWKLVDMEKTKQNILALIEKERSTLKSDLNWFKNELRSMSSNLKSRLADEVEKRISGYPVEIYREFFFNYQLVLEDMQARYLQLSEERFIKIATYLKAQERDKWVFNFFQVGQLPLLDNFGVIQKTLSSFIDSGGDVGRELSDMSIHYLNSINNAENIILKDVGKLFVDSGATFHTMLLKPINPGFSEDYKFQSVSSDAETMLKKISKQTGGSVYRSNSIKKFALKIVEAEDLLYVLTYVPDRTLKKREMRITTGNKNFRVEYDDRSRQKSFDITLKRMNLEKPPVVIERMTPNGQTLTVQLSNIKLVQQDNEKFGAVLTTIKIEDARSKVVAAFEKTYKGLKEEGIFNVELPRLPKGKYNIVLEVKDIFSLDNRFVGDAITVTVK